MCSNPVGSMYIATLGQASSGVRMWCPAGIAIDNDGFLYVCDFGSSICFQNVAVF